MRRSAALLLVSILALPSVAPSASWAQLRPPPRYSAGAAFDHDRGVLVIFGGYANEALGDTWEWNGTSWRFASATGPQPRNGPALAYDPVRRKTVLFGGDNMGVTRGDTWEWNGTTWTRLPVSGPAARTLARMSWDPARGKVLLFGGVSGTTRFGDVWEWSGTAWTRLSNDGPARFLFGMALAPDPSRLIVFGGNASPGNQAGNESGATWIWQSGVWDSVPDPGPGRRDHVAIAYDASRDRTVMYAGVRDAVILDDLWEFDGAHWSHVPYSGGGPGPRSFPQMVYDSRNDEVLLFAGFDPGGPKNDLWAWDGSSWRRADDEATATLLARFDVEPAPGGLRVRWELSGDLATVSLERAASDAGPWVEVARRDGAGARHVELLDRRGSPEEARVYRLIAHDANGPVVLGSIRWEGNAAVAFGITAVSPNPTTLPLVVDIALPHAGPATLTLIDVQGRVVATLADLVLAAGRHRVTFGGASIAPGVHFVRLASQGRASMRRVAVTR